LGFGKNASIPIFIISTFSERLRNTRKNYFRVFWKFLLRHYQIKYGFQIYPETQIGEGFYLGHWGSLVINPKAKIGKNCNIAQGVTIGQQNRGKNEGYPVIGDEVWIGPMPLLLEV
jgi:serine O-acetyltransferase